MSSRSPARGLRKSYGEVNGIEDGHDINTDGHDEVQIPTTETQYPDKASSSNCQWLVFTDPVALRYKVVDQSSI